MASNMLHSKPMNHSSICSIIVAIFIWYELLYNKLGHNLLSFDSPNVVSTFVSLLSDGELGPTIRTGTCHYEQWPADCGESEFNALNRAKIQEMLSPPSVCDCCCYPYYQFEVPSSVLNLKIRPLSNFRWELVLINHKYPQGMSVLSEHSITQGSMSCWLAAMFCLDWKSRRRTTHIWRETSRQTGATGSTFIN